MEKKTREPSYSPEDRISFHGGFDVDVKIDKAVHCCSDRDDVRSSGDDECIKILLVTLSTIKKSGEPINNSLAKAINSVMYNPISDEKLR